VACSSSVGKLPMNEIKERFYVSTIHKAMFTLEGHFPHYSSRSIVTSLKDEFIENRFSQVLMI
jgi:hypothetical protein